MFLRRILLPVAVVIATGAQAQSPKPAQSRDTTYRLPVVVTEGVRPIATSDGGSALDIRLDSLPLPAASNLDRALRDVPFMQIRTNPRGEAYFALRGSSFSAREVAVLVDGVPVSLNFDHRADLSLLPVAGIQTLTVVRGLPSLLYGPNVLGGVINLGLARVPLDAAAKPSARFESGIDQTGAYGVASSVSVPQRVGAGELLVRAGGGYNRSLGFPLPPSVHEPAPFGDGDLRLNSYHEQGDGFAALRYESDGGRWMSLSSSGYSMRRGVPAELNSKTPMLAAYPAERRAFSVLSLGTGDVSSLLGGQAALQANVGYDGGRTELLGFTTRTYDVVKTREADDDHNVTARVVADQTVASNGDLHAAITYGSVRRHEALAPGATSDYGQRLWSGATDFGWLLPDALGLSALRASAGAAIDAADTPDTAGKPAVGEMRTWGGRLGLAGRAGDRMLLHVGVNRRVRFPSLRELYSLGGQVQPNPNLRPEMMVAGEAGTTVSFAHAQLQAVAFHNLIKDEIVQSTTPQKKVQRINRDRTTATGLELLGALPIGRASFTADLTAQNVGGRNPTTATDFRAEYQPKFAGGASVTAPIAFGTALIASTRMVGAQYCVDAASAAGYDHLSATARTSVELSRRWRLASRGSGWFSGFETAVAADNVGAEAVYDQCGLPQPGRIVRFEMKFR